MITRTRKKSNCNHLKGGNNSLKTDQNKTSTKHWQEKNNLIIWTRLPKLLYITVAGGGKSADDSNNTSTDHLLIHVSMNCAKLNVLWIGGWL